jgi:hypothetical protein
MLTAGVGAVIGGISGAAVGTLLPTHSTIYNAAPHEPVSITVPNGITSAA